MDNIPGAESACGMKAEKVLEIRKMFHLMGHSAMHKLHAYQLSQQITR